MIKQLKENKAITLISLVITIVVLMILAGVAINLTLGENGVFRKAKQAKEQYGNAAESEEQQLNELYTQLNSGESLPENTPTTDAGTEVKLPDNWAKQTMRYVSVVDGKEVTNTTKVATVYAVSTGSGESVPVPYGFYYVGGTKSSGVVISDNANDKNKYSGQENVGKDLVGNQFVFIPCTIENYTKKNDWGYITSGMSWDTSTNSAEKTQIKKYGGFYVGRYEAGTSSATFSTDINAAVSTSNWQNACYTTANASAESKATTKAGDIPWFHADYSTAVTMSERMYNKDTDYVTSGLITGTQWDMMLKWMSTTADNSDLKANSNWGNYNNTTLTDCEGKYVTVNTSNGTTSAWQSNTTKTNRYSGVYALLTCGASETAKKKNLYDVAGNLWEWAQEYVNYSSTTNLFSLRGGSFGNAYASGPACYRHSNTASSTGTIRGFRPALYMK